MSYTIRIDAGNGQSKYYKEIFSDGLWTVRDVRDATHFADRDDAVKEIQEVQQWERVNRRASDSWIKYYIEEQS